MLTYQYMAWYTHVIGLDTILDTKIVVIVCLALYTTWFFSEYSQQEPHTYLDNIHVHSTQVGHHLIEYKQQLCIAPLSSREQYLHSQG